MSTNNNVKIVEVGARDGLQNENKQLSVEDRVRLIEQLIKCGVSFLEGGSFVSPKAIPQMLDSDKVWEKISSQKADISFLVPNMKGLELAKKTGVKSIAVFSATSDSFNKKNINKSVDESLTVIKEVCESAIAEKMKVRGYVSTAFGCPYEGFQDPKKLVHVITELFKMGCYEVSVGDTIGVAHPSQVKSVFTQLSKEFDSNKIAAHMHDTRGFALCNILEALDCGIRIFDSSIGGLGGCPYATGSSGNVATEEVNHLMQSLGLNTGISTKDLLECSKWVSEKLEKPLKSKFYLAQPTKLFYDRD